MFLLMRKVSGVGHEDEEDAEHDVTEVGEDVVEVGHQTELLSAKKIEVAQILGKGRKIIINEIILRSFGLFKSKDTKMKKN